MRKYSPALYPTVPKYLPDPDAVTGQPLFGLLKSSSKSGERPEISARIGSAKTGASSARTLAGVEVGGCVMVAFAVETSVLVAIACSRMVRVGDTVLAAGNVFVQRAHFPLYIIRIAGALPGVITGVLVQQVRTQTGYIL